MTDGITLQVNVAAVDAAYAKCNLAHLAAAHRAAVREVLVTIDACKPQKTKQTDPAVRCPEPQFSQTIEALRAMAEELQRDGLIDRVMLLQAGDPWLQTVSKKYSGPWLPETHDYGGRPITGYWAGIEAASTRYVAHYDGDMFVHQDPGFDWTTHAVEMLAKEPLAVSAAPRPTAPYDSHIHYGDYATIKEVMPLWPVNGGWKQYFFSTRAFLVDRKKL